MPRLTHYTKAYVWILLQIHREKLTHKQVQQVEVFLSLAEGKYDRRFAYAALNRLECLEYGKEKRLPRHKGA
jgi:hypothetical protein